MTFVIRSRTAIHSRTAVAQTPSSFPCFFRSVSCFSRASRSLMMRASFSASSVSFFRDKSSVFLFPQALHSSALFQVSQEQSQSSPCSKGTTLLLTPKRILYCLSSSASPRDFSRLSPAGSVSQRAPSSFQTSPPSKMTSQTDTVKARAEAAGTGIAAFCPKSSPCLTFRSR